MKAMRAACVVVIPFMLACGEPSAQSSQPAQSEKPAIQPAKPPSPPAKPPSQEPPSQEKPSPGATPVNPVGAAVLAFQQQLAEYVKIHKQADGKVPSLTETKDPAKISERQKALALAIQELRTNAKEGDVFVAEYQPYLIKVIKEDFAKRSAADRKALVVELPKNVKLEVNQVYPTTLPLETFPPKLLRALPDLPPELEYRIVGRNLILRDSKANLVVDILRNIVPTIPS